MKGLYPDEGEGHNRIVLSEENKILLSQIARWGKYIAVIGFILLLSSALVIIGVGITSKDNQANFSGEYKWSYAIAYLLFTMLYFFPFYFLYKFSDLTFNALYEEDSKALTQAFGFLKKHYKYITLISLVGMMFYILAAIIIGCNIH